MPQFYHGNDPAQQGWAYTGHNANSHVAFYERDGVKADYYYTTGEPQSLRFQGLKLVAPRVVASFCVAWLGGVAGGQQRAYRPLPCSARSGAPCLDTFKADLAHVEGVCG